MRGRGVGHGYLDGDDRGEGKCIACTTDRRLSTERDKENTCVSQQ